MVIFRCQPLILHLKYKVLKFLVIHLHETNKPLTKSSSVSSYALARLLLLAYLLWMQLLRKGMQSLHSKNSSIHGSSLERNTCAPFIALDFQIMPRPTPAHKLRSPCNSSRLHSRCFFFPKIQYHQLGPHALMLFYSSVHTSMLPSPFSLLFVFFFPPASHFLKIFFKEQAKE